MGDRDKSWSVSSVPPNIRIGQQEEKEELVEQEEEEEEQEEQEESEGEEKSGNRKRWQRQSAQ